MVTSSVRACARLLACAAMVCYLNAVPNPFRPMYAYVVLLGVHFCLPVGC